MIEFYHAFQSSLSAAGLDLVKRFNVSWYNRAVSSELMLPDFGRESCLGILVGNTKVSFAVLHEESQTSLFSCRCSLNSISFNRVCGAVCRSRDGRCFVSCTQALWDAFLRATRADPTLIARPDPLDSYVVSAVRTATDQHVPPSLRHHVRFAYETAPGRLVAVQRLAHLAGLAYLDTGTHLCVHPVYGPWIALRAVIVLDAPFHLPAAQDPPLLPPPCPSLVFALAAEATNRAIARLSPTSGATAAPAGESWREWLAARDVLSDAVGRAHRYSDDQILYHYTKDLGLLARLRGDEVREGASSGDTRPVQG